MKTSETDPLRIDTVPAPGGASIGLTICPGKKQKRSMSGPWDRDLRTDLDVVRDFRAAALVTLMPETELDLIEVPAIRLEEEVRLRGMEWIHLPIVDVGVPDRIFELRWAWAGARLRAHLVAGRPIVVHCRGGLGRSGLVAGRLLTELGMAPADAVAAVRAARPGAIETSEQEVHVLATGPLGPGVTRQDRIVGSLLGGAVGDALGAAIEFFPLDEILERHGRDGLREYARSYGRKGAITDDTQMTLYTAEGLLRGLLGGEAGPGPIVEVWDAYRRWLRVMEVGIDPVPEAPSAGWLETLPELAELRTPGNTCVGALRAGRMGTPEEPLNDSKGCGGVMRVAPVGLIAPVLPGPRTVFDLGCATAAITHGHPSGWLSAGVMAAAVAELTNGSDLESALDAASDRLGGRDDAEETLTSLTAARGLAANATLAVGDVERLGGGWVGEQALAIAVCCVIAADDFDDALALAVNHGGDSDSTGAIAGNLAGARDGAGAIAARWVEPLELADEILTVGLDLAACAEGRVTDEIRARYLT